MSLRTKTIETVSGDEFDTKVLAGLKKFTFRGIITFTFAFFYLPILAILYLSFAESSIPSYPIDSYTLKWYSQVFNDTRFIEGLYTSFEIGIVVSILGTIIGLMGAHTIVRSGLDKRLRLFGGIIIALPLFVPTVVIGVSLGLFASFINLGFGYLPVIMGHTIWVLPYSTFILTARYSELNAKLDEAAVDLGASPLEVFYTITLPLLGPALLAAFIFSFAASFNEFLITFFLAGTGMTTMPLEIFGLVKTGANTFLNAASVIVLLISGVLALLATRLRKPF